MEALIIAIVITYAIRKSAEQGHFHWQSARSANRRSTRGRSIPRRAASAVQHDIGYWAHQVTRGFPQARNGLASGWHAGRTAQARGRAQRAKARADHLEARARLIPEIREHYRRAGEALEEIRRQQQEEAGEGSREEVPLPVPGPSSEPPAGQEPGPSYSWGLAGARLHWPAVSREEAEKRARHMSGDGRQRDVAEYPPGGGPGRTVASYAGGEEIRRQQMIPAEEADPGRTGASTVLPSQPSIYGPAVPAQAAAGDREPFPVACDLCGQPLPYDYRGIAHPECIKAREENQAQPSPPTTEGNDMAADTTYDAVLQHASRARDFEEAALAERQQVVAQANAMAEQMQALSVDPATLGAMADHLDALNAAAAAQQRVVETAGQVADTLQRGHAGLKEAHDNAPVQAADTAFYQG
jgi:hypothetical protein